MMGTSWSLQFLDQYNLLLRRKLKEAEDLAPIYPDGCVTALRAFGELLLAQIAGRCDQPGRGNAYQRDETMYQFIRRLADRGCLTSEVAKQFHQLREIGNSSAHVEKLATPHEAKEALETAFSLALWFREADSMSNLQKASRHELKEITRIQRDHWAGLFIYYRAGSGRLPADKHLCLYQQTRFWWIGPRIQVSDSFAPLDAAKTLAQIIIGHWAQVLYPICETLSSEIPERPEFPHSRTTWYFVDARFMEGGLLERGRQAYRWFSFQELQDISSVGEETSIATLRAIDMVIQQLKG